MIGAHGVILLVEDNPDHAELVRRGFAQHSIAISLVHVEDGASALDYLFQRGSYADPASSPRPAIILLDLRLPKVDGLTVLQTIKTTPDLNRIPVIILTTSQAETDIARAYDHHANSYLVKPIGFPDFVALVRELRCYWLDWNIGLRE
ncbi:MAG: response regulator [Gammaproteobacteria bacterium]|nr:response regulator [Gammaproteobacteria bacterium]